MLVALPIQASNDACRLRAPTNEQENLERESMNSELAELSEFHMSREKLERRLVPR